MLREQTHNCTYINISIGVYKYVYMYMKLDYARFERKVIPQFSTSMFCEHNEVNDKKYFSLVWLGQMYIQSRRI